MSEDVTSAGRLPVEDLLDLFENAPCGYLSLTPDGRIFKANKTFSTWSGYSPDELTTKHLHDLLNMAGRIFFETHFAPLLRLQGFFNEVALDLTLHDGRRLPVLVNATERRDTDGTHLFTRLTVFNATDRRRYERDLLEARRALEATQKELEAANASMSTSLVDEQATAALREQFIAVLGHDLRNPLSAISGGMALLRRTPLNERAVTVVGHVEESVARMAELIANTLDFARGRLGGGITLQRNVETGMSSVLLQVVAELQTNAQDRSIETNFKITEAVDCDRSRVAQLASNLLGNAITHGAADQPILVEASTVGGWFDFSVTNAGEPVPAAIMSAIFEPFSRGNHRASRQGLGLGLYISHQIAKAHGGTLTVISDTSSTYFTFRMQLSA